MHEYIFFFFKISSPKPFDKIQVKIDDLQPVNLNEKGQMQKEKEYDYYIFLYVHHYPFVKRQLRFCNNIMNVKITCVCVCVVLQATDADITDVLTYIKEEDTKGRFSVNSATGSLYPVDGIYDYLDTSVVIAAFDSNQQRADITYIVSFYFTIILLYR
jgi:hypothetical protein